MENPRGKAQICICTWTKLKKKLKIFKKYVVDSRHGNLLLNSINPIGEDVFEFEFEEIRVVLEFFFKSIRTSKPIHICAFPLGKIQGLVESIRNMRYEHGYLPQSEWCRRRRSISISNSQSNSFNNSKINGARNMNFDLTSPPCWDQR